MPPAPEIRKPLFRCEDGNAAAAVSVALRTKSAKSVGGRQNALGPNVGGCGVADKEVGAG